jgi:hypothetical protein
MNAHLYGSLGEHLVERPGEACVTGKAFLEAGLVVKELERHSEAVQAYANRARSLESAALTMGQASFRDLAGDLDAFVQTIIQDLQHRHPSDWHGAPGEWGDRLKGSQDMVSLKATQVSAHHRSLQQPWFLCGKETARQRTGFMLAVTLVVGIGLGLLAGKLLHAQPEGITRTLLHKAALSGIKGHEAVMSEQ